MTSALPPTVPELSEATQLFRACFENAPLGIVLAREGLPPVFNAEYCRLFGYTREEMAGLDISSRITPDALPVLRTWMRGRIAGEAVPEMHETLGVRKDGTTFPLLVRLTVIDLGGAHWPLAFISDMTVLKEADDARRRSEEDLRLLIERIPDGILVETETEILFANPAMARLMGFERADELLGQDPTIVAVPEERALVRARMRRMFETRERPPPAERTLLRRDGTLLPVEVLPSGLIQFAGQTAVFVVVRDISTRRAMQARLLLADRLATVGTMAASVAHEINNPLTFVASNVAYAVERLAEARRDDALGESVRAALAAAEEGTGRMRDIVGRFAGFARVDEHVLKAVDVRAVLESSLRMAANELRHRARVVRAFDDVPFVMADEARLGQVFLNLLINASQALGDGPAGGDEIIRVRVHGTGERVVVEIHDNGPGIPPHVLPHIFDPFFTTKPVGVGTGLGLSISHTLITELGGEISVDTAPDRGTTFRVSLPGAADPLPQAVAADPVARLAPSRRARILVADDEPQIAAAIARCLDRHDVTVITSGRDALSSCRAHDWDLVLCDLMMPDVSGVELYETLCDTRPSVAERIVFMTGGAVTPRAREFVAGMQDRLIEKPFDLDRLLRLADDSVSAPPRT